MKRLLAPLALLLLAVPHCSAQSNPSPAPAAFTPDKGRFRITQQGRTAGTQDFELSRSGDFWIARSQATLRAAGAEVRATGQLRLRPDGTPVRYEWTAQGPTRASGSVEFENGLARTTIDLGGKEPVRQDFQFTSPRVVILDNNLYDHYALFARLYDWNARGAQTFPVLIPQDMTPGSVTVEALSPQTAGGATLETLRVRSPDLEILLYLDAERRLLRLEVPAAQVSIVRE